MGIVSAHDVLLHLRCHAPALARRLDGMRSLGIRGDVLTVGVDEDGWHARELIGRKGALEGEAARVFDRPVRVVVESRPPRPDPLPFPVTSTKYWNHLAFLAATAHGLGVVAVPKPVYLDQWLPQAAAGSVPDLAAASDDEAVRVFRYPAPVGTPTAEAWLAALPAVLDALASLARSHRSYAQLVMAFPGDPTADCLEAKLYGIKEWGTPHTPSPILHKYVGRLHYLAPDATHLGLRLAASASGPANR